MSDAVLRMTGRLRTLPFSSKDFPERLQRQPIWSSDGVSAGAQARGEGLGPSRRAPRIRRNGLIAGFPPQWHHIFPRKHFEKAKLADELIDALASIAVIRPTIKIRIGDQDPMEYLDKHHVTAEKLAQQLIPVQRSAFGLENYQRFLNDRSAALARAANEYLEEPAAGLPVNQADVAPAGV